MRFLDFITKRPPDMRTLGNCLWRNDVSRLDQALTAATTLLFKDLVESDVVSAATGQRLAGDETDLVAGHLTNLLDGVSLLGDYVPKVKDERLLADARRAQSLILGGEYPQLKALSTMAGTLLVIRLWYEQRFVDSTSVASHVIANATGKDAAEAYRVRGLSSFAAGDHKAALEDLLEARRLEPICDSTERHFSCLDAMQRSWQPAPLGRRRIRLRQSGQALPKTSSGSTSSMSLLSLALA